MELKDYTTEELRAEIKRRNELAKEAKMQEPRCRNCKHLTNNPLTNNPPWVRKYLCGVRTWGKIYTRHYCVKLCTKACDKFESKFE
jgi:hypothetical protein